MKKVSIVGGGIIGAMEAYRAFKEAEAKGEQIRITVYEAHASLAQTTAMLIAPSLTPDEILSVVPRGKALAEKLQILFNQPGGIKVEDVAGVAESASAKEFIDSVQADAEDEAGYEERTKALLELGKLSMDLWQDMYDEADAELKAIMDASNFKPCREPREAGPEKKLGDGYRIDLMSGIENAAGTAEGMKRDYESLGYSQCAILSPAETMRIDPSLSDFCIKHSEVNAAGERKWQNDAAAIWRPGGCIDVSIFLPKFYEYLENKMGKDARGKNLFHLKLNRKVEGVLYADADPETIEGVVFPELREKRNHQAYEDNQYVFCPGSAVGTLNKLGFKEPAYAGFAGASLKLNIPLIPELLEKYRGLNHCMEVRREGVVLAWQARVIGDTISIAVAGTKAFYGEEAPHKEQTFAVNRNTLQLNMINAVFPELIALALEREPRGQELTWDDLKLLEDKRILEDKRVGVRAVGVRAVAYDGFPILGQLYRRGARSLAVKNARCTTSLGSGGVSFARGAVHVSAANASTPFRNAKERVLVEQLRRLGDSGRVAVAAAVADIAA